MTRTMNAEQQQQARQLAEVIRSEASDIIEDIAQMLSALPDEELFGENEFHLRDRVLQLVGRALTARLAQKKTATAARASTAPSADKPPSSTATAADNRSG